MTTHQALEAAARAATPWRFFAPIMIGQAIAAAGYLAVTGRFPWGSLLLAVIVVAFFVGRWSQARALTQGDRNAG